MVRHRLSGTKNELKQRIKRIERDKSISIRKKITNAWKKQSPMKTVEAWECGTRKPSGSAARLLEVLQGQEMEITKYIVEK